MNGTPFRSSAMATRALMAALASMLLAGCSSTQLYAAGQGWQQQACRQRADAGERERCLADAARSHDDYQRETGQARGAQ